MATTAPPQTTIPTTPTWAIAVRANGFTDAGQWWDDGDGYRYRLGPHDQMKGWSRRDTIAAFVLLTPKQIAQIEEARSR
jgi:hypothetical protein